MFKILYNIILILNIYFFIGIFFNSKKFSILRFIMCFVLLIAKSYFITKFNLSNFIIDTFIIIFIVKQNYYGNLFTIITFSLIFNALLIELDFLTIYLLLLLNPNRVISKYNILLLSELILFIIILILKYFFRRKDIGILPNKYNFIFLFITIGSLSVVYNTFIINSISNFNKNNIIFLTISSIIILLINLIIFYIYLHLYQEIKLKIFNDTYLENFNLLNKYIDDINKEIININQHKHNIKHEIILLKELLKKNKINNMNIYLEEILNKSSKKNNKAINTGNIVVDSIMNFKYSIMKNNYIKFDYNINIPIDFNYDISDISILLGNILDNSIEAVNKLPIKKRYISFFMEYKNKTLFITIKNKFNGRIIKDNNNNNILTSKKDCNKHGLGLLSIKNIVNKYFGEFNVDIKENVFIIKILLFEIN